MCDYIKIDNELIDKERGKHKLPKPVEFEGGMLSQELDGKAYGVVSVTIR